MSEKRNVPDLRFKEFEEGWNLEKVQNQFDLISGQHLNPDEYTEKRGAKYLTPYFTGPSDFTSNDSKLSKWALKPTKTSKTGDLLITVKGSGVGAMMIQSFNEVAIGRQLMAFRKTKGSTGFLFHRLQPLRNFFFALASGNMIPGLTREDLLSTKIFFPSLPEQQKIAEFLTEVDRRIELLQTKKEKLEAYKKGVMQKIFSQQLRFKADDGSDFPDWEERKLGEVLDYEQPTKYLVSSTEYSDNYSTPVLTAGKTFLLGFTDETTGIFDKNLPTIIFDDFTTAFQFVDFPFKAKSSAMKMLIPKDSEVNIRYVFSAMLLIKYTPGDHKRHWISEFQEFEIPYPCEAEQTKIVQFLTSLDRSIENVNQQITHTQTWKKGLLQKMFV